VDEGCSVDEVSLSLKRLRGGPGGSFVTGDPGEYVKKVPGCGHPSLRPPLDAGGGVVYRGSG
jgi:hypothetical protein